jgi:hypothetical protein
MMAMTATINPHDGERPSICGTVDEDFTHLMHNASVYGAGRVQMAG